VAGRTVRSPCNQIPVCGTLSANPGMWRGWEPMQLIIGNTVHCDIFSFADYLKTKKIIVVTC